MKADGIHLKQEDPATMLKARNCKYKRPQIVVDEDWLSDWPGAQELMGRSGTLHQLG